ncbi:MAG: RNA methyltransferase [Fibrobacterales bacterium]
MNSYDLDKEALLKEYGDKLTERRITLLNEALQQRTRHFTLVLEDLFDPHNISALIRTSEVYGLQDVHVIEEENPYRISKSVLKGSFKWLNLYKYKQRTRCMENLRAQGYQIAVASTNTDKTIDQLDLSVPTAFYMGAEFRGNHPDTLKEADVHFILPQYGLTESMNVSVAGGVLMTYLDVYLRQEGRRAQYGLSEEEKKELQFDWYERCCFGIERNSPLTQVE